MTLSVIIFNFLEKLRTKLKLSSAARTTILTFISIILFFIFVENDFSTLDQYSIAFGFGVIVMLLYDYFIKYILNLSSRKSKKARRFKKLSPKIKAFLKSSSNKNFDLNTSKELSELVSEFIYLGIHVPTSNSCKETIKDQYITYFENIDKICEEENLNSAKEFTKYYGYIISRNEHDKNFPKIINWRSIHKAK